MVSSPQEPKADPLGPTIPGRVEADPTAGRRVADGVGYEVAGERKAPRPWSRCCSYRSGPRSSTNTVGADKNTSAFTGPYAMLNVSIQYVQPRIPSALLNR